MSEENIRKQIRQPWVAFAKPGRVVGRAAAR